MRNRHESGFTLIELMVAMVCTLLVTGAVYGLLTGGQNAFRREPELSDRQQNIRAATDMIMRDVASAGESMPAFIQTFTTGLDGASLGACTDNTGASVTCPQGPSGAVADELEILANPGSLAGELACGYSQATALFTDMAAGTTQIQQQQIVMILLNDNRWTLRYVNSIGTNATVAGVCNGGTHSRIGFSASTDPTSYNLAGVCAGAWNGTQCGLAPGNACLSASCQVASILAGDVVRYRIRYTNGVPNLERFSSGDPSSLDVNGNRQYQVVARGIDDLQVQYVTAGCNPVASPCPPVDNAPLVDNTAVNYNTLIQSVTVTLSARSEAQNLAGMQSATVGPNALRGSLTSVGTPRAALNTLATPAAQRNAGAIGPSPWPVPWN